MIPNRAQFGDKERAFDKIQRGLQTKSDMGQTQRDIASFGSSNASYVPISKLK